VIIEDTIVSFLAQSVSFLYKKHPRKYACLFDAPSRAVLSAPLDWYSTTSSRLVLVYDSDKRVLCGAPVPSDPSRTPSGGRRPRRPSTSSDVAAIRTHTLHKAGTEEQGKAVHSQYLVDIRKEMRRLQFAHRMDFMIREVKVQASSKLGTVR
jgi:hypothetical protein